MALMWPRELPNHIKLDPRRDAESRVFEKLSRELDDEWYVYYSRPWWGINARGGEIDGEADFIIANENKGILFIEVKGGGITYTPDSGKWQTIDRNGITHNIKDPVLQAMSCKHQFLNKLKKLESWPKSYIRFRHGVIFPDSKLPSGEIVSIGANDVELFCFLDDFEFSLRKWVESRLRSHLNLQYGEVGPGSAGMLCLQKLIADPVKLKVPLKRSVESDLSQMNQLLTGVQLALINILITKSRVLVEGGAGTGKTILAIESAIRESELGRKVLFCCKSYPLAQFIKKTLKSFINIIVVTIEEFQFQFANNELTYAYDSLYIDEGQDIDIDFWEKFNYFPSISLKVFADSNQAIYRLRDDLATRLGLASFPLAVNLRNTKKIAGVTEHLYDGPLIHSAGPDGLNPISYICEIEDAKYMIVDLIRKLNIEESIPLSMITLLVPNAEMRENLISILSRSKISCSDAIRSNECEVIVETITRFKGLEAPIVILLADRLVSKNQELSYVAVSRARSRLYIFGPTTNTLLGSALG